MIMKVLRSYKKIVHLPFRELQIMAMAQVMNTCILVHVKSLISHWTTCIRVAGLCLTLENGPVYLFTSPVSTSIDWSCSLINNAFLGTEGTECSPVLPYQCREQVAIYFSSPAEIRSSQKVSAFLSMAVITMKLSTRPHFKQNTCKESINNIYYFVHLEPAKLICTILTMWAIPVRSVRLVTIKLVLLGRQLQTNHKFLKVDQTGPFTQKLSKVFCDVAGNVAFQNIP